MIRSCLTACFAGETGARFRFCRGLAVLLALALPAFNPLVPAMAQDDALYLSEAFTGARRELPAGWIHSQTVPGRVVGKVLNWPAGGVNAGDGLALMIRGTGDRNNAVRRQLDRPIDADSIYVRFVIEYDEDSVDSAADNDGEFFVLWLDASEGSDTATHSGRVPNIGLHVDAAGRNAFMVRFSPESSAFADVELAGGRPFLIVARLWKSTPGAAAAFDSLDLWVNPRRDQRDQPMARSISRQGMSAVHWIGFSTGRKTEPDDLIFVDQLMVAATWEAVLGLPPAASGARSFRDAPSTLLTPRRLTRPAPFGNGITQSDGAGPEPASVAAGPTSERTRAVDDVVHFREQVYPLLKSRCFPCHAGPDAESGYRLDVLEDVLGESTGEPLVIPRDTSASRILHVVSSAADPGERMPPADAGPPLSDSQVEELRRWVKKGVAWDDALLPPTPVHSDHWAFQPVVRPPVPRDLRDAVSDEAAHGNAAGGNAADGNAAGGGPVGGDVFAGTSPIDAFLRAKRRQRGVTAVARADRRTWIRRLSLDLLGIPPAPADVEAFVRDDAPDARDRLVDRLLASPAYGERWGRHWLDVARFAESNGYQHNRLRPHAWRYRDYVIDSFNSDRPFDEFIRQQIAGDELQPCTDDNIIATGFLAAARYSGNEKDKRLQRSDLVADVVNSVGSGLLGLTFGCAQCHNHKFDPVTIRDYYRFAAFFLKGQPVNVVLHDAADLLPYDAETRALLVEERNVMFERQHALLFERERRRRPRGDIFILPKTVERAITGSERIRYEELGRAIDRWPQAWAFYSPLTAASELAVPRLEVRWALPFGRDVSRNLQPRILLKGNPHDPGPAVEPGWPAVFGPVPDEAPLTDRPRTVLADWLTSPQNPLTARVWVNRLWQEHFGRGLVADAGNFGVRTPQPLHAELLDWLAAELIKSGWSTKHMHRLMVSSEAYQLSSDFDGRNSERDPENELYWRWYPRRLEAEAIRDSLLAVTGELTRKMHGPSVPDSDSSNGRRSIYLLQKRDAMPVIQNLFDGPDAVAACSRRRVSTVPLQPLFLLNSDFMRDRAAALADLVAAQADTDEARVRTVFRRLLAREPDARELEQSLKFLRRSSEDRIAVALSDGPTADSGLQPSDQTTLRQFCLAMLNLNEFLYLP